MTDDSNPHLVMIYETSGGKCGLQTQNRKRLYAPNLSDAIVDLQKGAQQDFDAFEKKRRKRSSTLSEFQKAIEIAVFVDDDMYRKATESSTRDPVDEIQNLVFTYLNSVQLLYQSPQLDTKFRIILVRLEIFKSSLAKLDKKGGNIEGYLDSFCKWQSKENPEYWDKLSDDPDRWDHALMLTGLNLYDGTKEHSSVIGKKITLHENFVCVIW